MIETVVQDRNRKLAEYLQLLRLMAFELDRAMKAIAQNSLTGLEDSIANQQVFSDRLGELAEDFAVLRASGHCLLAARQTAD